MRLKESRSSWPSSSLSDAAAKVSLLTLTNTSATRKRLSVFGYVEWCLGPPRAGERRFVVTERDEDRGALLARNPYNVEFAGQVAFWHATETARAFTCDRGEFVGRTRDLNRPAALLRPTLLERAGAALDPCAALQIEITLDPGQTRRWASFSDRARPAAGTRARGAVWRSGRVRSGVGCRRAGVGRHARRDRGQDSRRLLRPARQPLAALPDAELPDLGAQRSLSAGRRLRLPRSAAGRPRADVDARPDLAAIICCAPRRGSSSKATSSTGGIRQAARHPDALLGRPALAAYAVAAYVSRTGDAAVLDEAYRSSRRRRSSPIEHEIYDLPPCPRRRRSLFEHCVRAHRPRADSTARTACR